MTHTNLIGAATALVLAASAHAQIMPSMPGMKMPGTHQPLKARPLKAAHRRLATKAAIRPDPASARRRVVTRASRTSRLTVIPPVSNLTLDVPPPPARDVRGDGGPAGNASGMPGMAMPARPERPGPSEPQSSPMSGMPGMTNSSAMPGMSPMTMKGALGHYSETREASGTSWQPDASEHMGYMTQVGDWSLMGHGVLNLVYDHQGSPRGADKVFASGMLMGMAQRPLGNGTLQFKAMLSPDPLMGASGYPLLLASGETANGRDRLVDRQHPHDLFMELSASLSHNIGPNSSLFVYGGLPGEPAFGPPAFMHREAIMDSPEAPISHHWLDATHISFGVVTGGVVVGNAKAEVSRFNGREPDQHRFNIETGPLDSTAVRVSWNPNKTLSLQGSYGFFKDPEQLEPGVNQKRLSASALYADEIAPGYKLATTLAWGRKTVQGRSEDAFALEASIKHADWTVFGRAEQTENSELVTSVERGPSYRVAKASFGVVHDIAVAKHLALGIGALVSINAVPDALVPLYGGNHPVGAMGFVRMKVR